MRSGRRAERMSTFTQRVESLVAASANANPVPAPRTATHSTGTARLSAAHQAQNPGFIARPSSARYVGAAARYAGPETEIAILQLCCETRNIAEALLETPEARLARYTRSTRLRTLTEPSRRLVESVARPPQAPVVSPKKADRRNSATETPLISSYVAAAARPLWLLDR